MTRIRDVTALQAIFQVWSQFVRCKKSCNLSILRLRYRAVGLYRFQCMRTIFKVLTTENHFDRSKSGLTLLSVSGSFPWNVKIHGDRFEDFVAAIQWNCVHPCQFSSSSKRANQFFWVQWRSMLQSRPSLCRWCVFLKHPIENWRRRRDKISLQTAIIF